MGRRRGPPRTNPLPENSSTATSTSVTTTNVAAEAAAETKSLRSAIQLYDELARQLRGRLSDGDRGEIDHTLSRIRMSLPHELLQTGSVSPGGSEGSYVSPEDIRERYLGEASDVRFFNSVKDIFQDQSTTVPIKLESYETETRTTDELLPSGMPKRADADKYVDWWMNGFNKNFAVQCEQAFRRDYCKFWETRSIEGLEVAFLPTMRTSSALCARPATD